MVAAGAPVAGLLAIGVGTSGAGACCWPVGAVLAAGLLDVDDRDDPLAPLDADACRWASTCSFTQNSAVHECASAAKRVCSRVNASMCASMVEELTPARVLLRVLAGDACCWLPGAARALAAGTLVAGTCWWPPPLLAAGATVAAGACCWAIRAARSQSMPRPLAGSTNVCWRCTRCEAC